MSQHAQWEDSFKMLDIMLCIIFFIMLLKKKSKHNDQTAMISLPAISQSVQLKMYQVNGEHQQKPIKVCHDKVEIVL